MLPQEDMIDLVAGNWLRYEIELETEFPLRWLPSAFLNLLDYIDQKYLLFCPCQSYAIRCCHGHLQDNDPGLPFHGKQN